MGSWNVLRYLIEKMAKAIDCSLDGSPRLKVGTSELKNACILLTVDMYVNWMCILIYNLNGSIQFQYGIHYGRKPMWYVR